MLFHNCFVINKLIFYCDLGSKFKHGHESCGVEELAKSTNLHLRDPGLNLSTDRKYFLIQFVSHSILIQNCSVLTLEQYL
jgi:hypothetical protein